MRRSEWRWRASYSPACRPPTMYTYIILLAAQSPTRSLPSVALCFFHDCGRTNASTSAHAQTVSMYTLQRTQFQ
jgi:hypothetical protein